MTLRPLIASCFIPVVLACAAQPQTPANAPASNLTQAADAAAVSVPRERPAETADTAPPTLDESTYRRLPDDSVYPLLAAEFALRKRDYPTAMNLYMEQAAKLRDPAVSAHATHLAQYLQREDAAREAVTLWVELEPDNPEPHNTLATLLVREGRLLEAVEHLAIVARDDESNARFPILMNGFGDLDPEEQQAMVEALDALMPDLSDSISLLMTRALVADEMGDPERALARLGDVFAQEPFQHQALLLEARMLQEQGSETPFARIEQALEDDAGRDRLRLQYARLLARDDMDAAREQFEILSAGNPEDGDLLFSLALINEELDDPEAAKRYLQQLLKQRQRTSEAYFVLGRIAESEDDTAQAIEHYMQVGDGKDLLAASMRIGVLLLAQDQQARFSGYFATLRQSYPARSEQLYALQANLLNEARRDDASLALLNEAINTFPDSTSLRYARSVVYERRDNIDAAVADLRSIIGREPANATALNALGYTLANRTDQLDEAHSLIREALALEPNEPAILDSMGWVLYRQGEYDAAIDYLTRAYAGFPDPEVAAHLGEVMWMNDDPEGARNIWRGALLQDPEHPVLRETLQRLGVDDLP
ncbi:tetratricopeptide repeat protein [Chromatocurvus halotolerans]|uniref:Flp pilus assembly protein TadD n=1 Tax=Chromatocurvus halotolerans TaxID=1132028 RepID=A0A4R2KTS3_9GAMM|nr:tetratricopeptide repeat protein [Chromatocurvus halotolerans]TCO76252.1 Flp pilus assembly protein TadD [Chromatocurvus halotolerans]